MRQKIVFAWVLNWIILTLSMLGIVGVPGPQPFYWLLTIFTLIQGFVLTLVVWKL